MNRFTNCTVTMLILSATVVTTSASAQVVATDYPMSPKYPITHLNSVSAGSTAGSFAAAAMMGAQGYSNYLAPAGWESTVVSNCATQTALLTGPTLWPNSCNPTGMAAATKSMTGNTWVTEVYPETDQDSAMNLIVNALYSLKSPAIIPLFGQADHWVTVYSILGTYEGSSKWTIKNMRAYDGGPPGADDSGGNSYFGGYISATGSFWKNAYYKVITAININCDPNCTSDYFYKKHLVMYEPPPGSSYHEKANFPRAPGIITAGQHMNSLMAHMRLWDSLVAGDVDKDPQVWNAIQGGVPGAAWEVHGVLPSGAPWDYYLVPILSNTATAIAFVQLAADDGSFESIVVPDNPISFTPVTMSKAFQIARNSLGVGEHLTGGLLTWDPSQEAPIKKSPISPYYEFGIIGQGHTDAGVIRVSLNGASVLRSQ